MVQWKYLAFSSQDKWIQIQALLLKGWIISRVCFSMCEHILHLISTAQSLPICSGHPTSHWDLTTSSHRIWFFWVLVVFWGLWVVVLFCFVAFVEISPAIPSLSWLVLIFEVSAQIPAPLRSLWTQPSIHPSSPTFRLYMPLSEPLSPTRTKSLLQGRALSHPPFHSSSYYWHSIHDENVQEYIRKRGGTFWWEGVRYMIKPCHLLRNAAADHKSDSRALTSTTPKFSV